MATKKEMVTELVFLGAVEEEIKDLKNTELEALLVKAKEIPASVQGEEPLQPEAPTVGEEESKGEVVRETSQQLGIFTDYIYNVRHLDAAVVVDNLGYGDIYVSTEGLATVGKSERLSFKETKEFKGVDKLYFTSASQPVVQILEVK